MRDDIEAFLSVSGQPTEAELRLWEAVLAPFRDEAMELMAAWLRSTDAKPTPFAVLDLGASRVVGGAMWVIAEKIATLCGVTVKELLSRDRDARVNLPRQQLMYELRAARFSIYSIGRFLHRDHTTVRHGADKHAARLSGAR